MFEMIVSLSTDGQNDILLMISKFLIGIEKKWIMTVSFHRGGHLPEYPVPGISLEAVRAFVR